MRKSLIKAPRCESLSDYWHGCKVEKSLNTDSANLWIFIGTDIGLTL